MKSENNGMNEKKAKYRNKDGNIQKIKNHVEICDKYRIMQLCGPKWNIK